MELETLQHLNLRLKRLAVPQSSMIDVASGKARLTNIPEGATILTVQFDWSERTFNFILSSPDFDQVPEGSVLPRILAELEWVSQTDA